MTLKGVMEQAQQAVYWMEAAADADFQKKTNPRKRKDGHAEWLNAAYNLGNLLGREVSEAEIKEIYYAK